MELTKDEIAKAGIIAAAQKLFQHYGLNKTTMEDISKALGKSKSSLYYYYATKEDIFEAVVQREKDIIFSDIKKAIGKTDSAKEKFKVFALTKFKEIKKRQILHKIVLDEVYDNVCLYELIKKRYDTIENDILKSIIAHGVETGEFVIDNNRSIEAVSLVCAITLRGVQMNFMFDNNGDCGAMDDLLDLSIDMLLKTLENNVPYTITEGLKSVY